MRNRRVRLLLLAVLLTFAFFLYSRSDPETIDQAKRYAERTYHQAEQKYHQALDQTLGKKTDKLSTSQSDSVNAALENKKDEPFRVDFGAYSKAAGLVPEETTQAPNLPPPAAPVPVKKPEKPEPAPVAEPKKEDHMRVDFDYYTRAATVETPVAAPGVDPLNNPVIANPNPIAGHSGSKEDTRETKGKDDTKVKPVPKSDDKKIDEKKSDEKIKPKGLLQQADKASLVDSELEIGQGRVEIDTTASMTAEPVHWTRVAEKYPITSTNPYPYADAKKIPKIQHDFKRDPASGGADADKLAEIKKATLHSWTGYRDQAIGNDEVTPVSGKYANPFNGWGATLVDALDTLWLMGMKDEFEEALTYVKKIDFTTSRRADIPLFETTIRYLGGLLGAYEISGRNYDVLYDKIKQLGEILYGAFDTPNRMPMTYYKWKPEAAGKQRAKRKTIMAELGSLSLEFTRLGQIVAEPKYYDAIARITHALGEWQDETRIPGLWPTTLDASGCKAVPGDEKEGRVGMTTVSTPKDKEVDINPKLGLKSEAVLDTGITAGSPSLKEPGIGKIAGFGNPIDEGALDSKSAKDSLLEKGSDALRGLIKRAADGIGFSADDVAGLTDLAKHQVASEQPLGNSALPGIDKTAPVAHDSNSCIPQGLTETDPQGSDVYTLGAAADSTYEYLPKMHLLLGGRSDEYRKMYVKAADASMKNLVYRAMIPDEKREILFAGNVDTRPKGGDPKNIDYDFKPVMTHLTCFIGGMFGMASKIFDRPEDLVMAKKLADGCVWAYNVTASGIMPEIMGMSKCDSIEKCKWDKTKYYAELDPFPEARKPQADASKSTKAADAVKAPLSKRQFDGGEMQYGGQSAASRAAAASIGDEVPPLGMGQAPPKDTKPGVSDKPDFVLEKKPSAAAEEPIAKKTADEPVAKKPTKETSNESVSKKTSLKDTTDEPTAKKPIEKPDFVLENKPVIKEPSSELPPKPKVEKNSETPLSHEEFVEKKIKDERLPPGMVGMYDKKYELRPEAIESVFYMYRITGEQYWRDRGWEMWQAVSKATKAKYGASAIDDVSKKSPEPKDREESFWLAETLKYFYLLFDDPDRVSLDDWVLNTEAHFLTRLGS